MSESFEDKLAQIDIEELIGAEQLFKAYREGVGGAAFNGDRIPEWHELPNAAKVKYGWVCAFRHAMVWAKLRKEFAAIEV